MFNGLLCVTKGGVTLRKGEVDQAEIRLAWSFVACQQVFGNLRGALGIAHSEIPRKLYRQIELVLPGDLGQ